jgi:hypothetical protein
MTEHVNLSWRLNVVIMSFCQRKEHLPLWTTHLADLHHKEDP